MTDTGYMPIGGLFGRPLADSVLDRGLVALEEHAQLQFDLGRNLRKEVVGLGFRVQREYELKSDAPMSAVEQGLLLEEFSWVQLTNTLNVASAGGNAGNEFMVSGDEIRFVLRRVEEYLLRRGGMSAVKAADMARKAAVTPRVEFVLWHSHYNHVEPSGRDVQIFPKWLANVGVVYHAPTQTSTRYSGAGIIPPVGVSNSGASTTGDNA